MAEQSETPSPEPSSSITPQSAIPPIVQDRMAEFQRQAVSVRLKNFGKNLSEGMAPNEAAQSAGYLNAATAVNALASIEFTINLRSSLNKRGLDPEYLAEQLKWGIEKSQDACKFKEHGAYLTKLMDLFKEAFPQEPPNPPSSHAPNHPIETFKQFQGFLNKKLKQKDAEIVTRAIREFIQDSD